MTSFYYALMVTFLLCIWSSKTLLTLTDLCVWTSHSLVYVPVMSSVSLPSMTNRVSHFSNINCIKKTSLSKAVRVHGLICWRQSEISKQLRDPLGRQQLFCTMIGAWFIAWVSWSDFNILDVYEVSVEVKSFKAWTTMIVCCTILLYTIVELCRVSSIVIFAIV